MPALRIVGTGRYASVDKLCRRPWPGGRWCGFAVAALSPLFGDTAAMAHPQERAMAHVTTLATGEPVDPSWRVTLHFHPDRLVAGVPMLARMAREGVYRSQFETGTSNGGLPTHPGGERWRWESRIFAGAYDHARPQTIPLRTSDHHGARVHPEHPPRTLRTRDLAI